MRGVGLGRSVVLVVVWVLLWGEISVANIASGVLAAAVIGVAFPVHARGGHRLHPLAALRLGGYVLVNLVTSSIAVVLAVLRPTPERVHAEVVELELTSRSPLVAALVSNCITLTPGTMTVEADPATSVLRVHVLGRVDHEEFRDRVRALERRVVAAVERGAT